MLGDSENPSAEESKESIRGLVKKLAADQLKALGYEEVLAKIREWFTGQPLRDFQFSPGISDDSKVQFEQGLLEACLNQLLRIPDKDEARRLVVAAVFGEAFSKDLIVSYRLEEPSIKSIQTEFDPNGDSKDKLKLIPNTEGSKRLVAQVSNTGFIPDGQTPVDVVRKLSWGNKSFDGIHIDDPSIKMEITPQGSSYLVQIRKTSPGVSREIHP